MFHINSYRWCNVARMTGLLASLGLGLASGNEALAQSYDRMIRPSDITLEPSGQEGYYMIDYMIRAVNGTESELDLSMDATVLVNNEIISTELLTLLAAGEGQTCSGSCPGNCSHLGPDSACLDLGTVGGVGCACSVVVRPQPLQPVSLSVGDIIDVTIEPASGAVPEVYPANDSAQVVVGVPAATVTSAVSRKTNPQTRAFCDTDLHTVPPRKAEPHQGGIQEIRIGFDVAPAGGGSGWTLEQATCPAPAFVPYGGASTGLGRVLGNELVITFTPGLENARSYLLNLDATITSIGGQNVEVRGLIGDVNSDGSVNATDRSLVVGTWTGGGFSCPTDISNDGQTNATDRSTVVGAWTGGASTNCAP